MAVKYEQDEYSSGMSAKHNSMGFVKNGQYSDGLEIWSMKTILSQGKNYLKK